MYVLGINGAWHDTAACLLKDGVVIAAAEEERFTRIKHGKTWGLFNTAALPFHAIHYCLAEAGITLNDVEHIAYAANPLLLDAGESFDGLGPPENPTTCGQSRMTESLWWAIYRAGIQEAANFLVDDAPWHLRDRILGTNRQRPLEALISGDPEKVEQAWRRENQRWQWHWVEHHVAHAASAFFPSPFDRAAVMTLDGAGEVASTAWGVGSSEGLELLGQVDLPHSLGKLYERVTTQLGFLSNSDEYKVMALASYGEPRFADTLRRMVIWVDDLRYEIDGTPLELLFGPRRERNTALEEHHFDLAASAQLVLEEAGVRLATNLRAVTGASHLCLAGGVALNCVMNSVIRDRAGYDAVWTQPAAGDAGAALGAALSVWHSILGHRDPRWRMEDVYLGPGYSDESIEATLTHAGITFTRPDDIAAAAATQIARGRVVAWFQGRMEYGPRALGSRSFVADASSPDMMRRMNILKDREDFRPVAPAVTEDALPRYFAPAVASPFMTFVHTVIPEQRASIPAVCHVDGTARVQTVDPSKNPLYHRLIVEVGRQTGNPVIVNTSFNSKGRPIVCSPSDALECFFSSPVDVLAIGPFLVEKRPNSE